MRPILDKTSASQSKLTLSNDFSVSRVIMAKSPSPRCLAWSKTIRTLRMLSEAVLPFTKPDCAGWIKEGMILASLVAIIFHRILTSKFKREMGLYKPGSSGSFPFFEISFTMAWLPEGR